MAAHGDKAVDAAQLEDLVRRIFVGCGMSAADAGLMADSLVDADLGGVHSHGVLRVPEYVDKLRRDGVDAAGRPKILREMGACLVVDGGNSMGQIGAAFAMEQAVERAQRFGIGAAAVGGSNHCGAMAYYVKQAAARDMIGIATTNALPTMAPWGGAERILGINPLGLAVPAGEEWPIVYDAAFSGSSHGKIRIYQQKGLTLPEGWALDAEGRPTVDPAAAIDGLLMPVGGFKGAGMAMIMGILSSLLSGASYGTELGDMEKGPEAGADGHFIAAINVAAFEDLDRFKARVDGAIRQIRDCRLAVDAEAVYAPGELEFRRRVAYSRDGIPLNRVTREDIGRVAAQFELDSGFLR